MDLKQFLDWGGEDDNDEFPGSIEILECIDSTSIWGDGLSGVQRAFENIDPVDLQEMKDTPNTVDFCESNGGASWTAYVDFETPLKDGAVRVAVSVDFGSYEITRTRPLDI